MESHQINYFLMPQNYLQALDHLKQDPEFFNLKNTDSKTFQVTWKGKLHIIRYFIAVYTGVPIESILSKKKDILTAFARHLCNYFGHYYVYCNQLNNKKINSVGRVNNYQHITLTDISHEITGKHHATLLNSVQKINNWIDTKDQLTIQEFTKIKSQLDFLFNKKKYLKN